MGAESRVWREPVWDVASLATLPVLPLLIVEPAAALPDTTLSAATPSVVCWNLSVCWSLLEVLRYSLRLTRAATSRAPPMTPLLIMARRALGRAMVRRALSHFDDGFAVPDQASERQCRESWHKQ